MNEHKKFKYKKYYSPSSNKNNKYRNDNNNSNNHNLSSLSGGNYSRKEKYYKVSKNKNGYYKKNHNEKTVEEYENIYIERKKKDGKEKPICPICNNEIYIIEQSILYGKTKTPAHFDCIIKHLSKDNQLEENEKIVYLGSGTFGIIQERAGGRGGKFFVRKRIIYEDRKVNKKDDIDLEEEELFNV